jgi:aldehyde:ferredoxin oxidoreductase
MVALVNAVTGWDVDIDETQAIGQRTITLSRIFNLREGFTAKDDNLPRRFFKPFLKGEERKAEPLDEDAFQWAKRRYYGIMGWDEKTGIPTSESLERLDISWAADHLSP